MSEGTYARALAELRSLAVGSVVLDCDGDAWQLTQDGWSCTVRAINTSEMDASSVAILAPITVIHRTTDCAVGSPDPKETP